MILFLHLPDGRVLPPLSLQGFPISQVADPLTSYSGDPMQSVVGVILFAGITFLFLFDTPPEISANIPLVTFSGDQ
jgi:hypothetical protein